MLAVAIGGIVFLRRRSPKVGVLNQAAIFLIIWFSVVTVILVLEIYRPIFLPVFLLLPPMAMLVWMRSRSAKLLIDTLPQQGLVGIQIFRVVGGSFLFLWQDGYMPGLFAIPVGIGDIMVGVWALLLLVLMNNNRCPSGLIVAWNLFGLADHIMALFLGATTSPGPLQRYALEQPNYLPGAFPVAIIPTFIIPLSFILHGLSLWRLRRDAVS